MTESGTPQGEADNRASPQVSPSLCDTCKMPGSCCKFFVLSVDFNEHDWAAEARTLLDHNELHQFIPHSRTYCAGDEAGRTHVLFTCTWLGLDGRCMNYAERPYTCYDYQPGHDGLCAEHTRKFRNIPIKVEGAVR